MHSGRVGRSSDLNLWQIPLGFSLASLALFGLTMIPDVLDARGFIHIPDWISMGSIDDARAILSAMLSCVSTVLALIFSVALLVLSMVATLFGPRLLYRFVQDWVTQATIGLFMGTFIYLCLVFLVTHSDSHSTLVPQVSLITSWFLVIASFGFLLKQDCEFGIARSSKSRFEHSPRPLTTRSREWHALTGPRMPCLS